MRISDWSSDVCSSDLVTLSRFGGGTSNAVTNNEQRLFVSAPLANDRLGLRLSGVRTFHSGFLTDISPGSDGRYGRPLTENLAARAEESRGGKEWVRTVRTWGSPDT